MSYKWATAHDWLFATFNIPQPVRDMIVRYVSADDIQDCFQSEMDDDGFFDSDDPAVDQDDQ